MVLEWHWSSIVFEPLQPATFIRNWQRLLPLASLFRSLRVKTCWKRKGSFKYETVKTCHFLPHLCLEISQVPDQNKRSRFSVVVCTATTEDDTCQTTLQTTKQWSHQGQCLVLIQHCYSKMCVWREGEGFEKILGDDLLDSRCLWYRHFRSVFVK